ncbi:hypothetical protein RclHR1_01220057 [Rhizophagus clarus]|uniref:Uncharacterized protein n=1 Tax=Rhizophagus clarus TaxID=94130 RepID=A0A2Z6QLX1_9GLOM|nr:hypothetical protein RclHR1_01220057 [Rhizophagus clarus]GES85737.1 hypothetical protein GLOIN_2v1883137 [Rhizophagus clarus]
MPRPSRNNRRKTTGLFTTNPKQYLQFQNFAKYKHIYDAQLDYIIVVNRETKDPKATFNCADVISYLEINDHHEYIRNINALRDNDLTKHFNVTIINSEKFTVKALGMKFLFIKDNLDNLVIFKDKEWEINDEVIMTTPDEDISHIHYKGTRIYFNSYVIADMEYEEIIKSIIGFLSFYYQK